MFVYHKLIRLNREIDTPIFLQISNEFIDLIKKGLLKAGQRLPGTRSLSKELGVHRKTVISAFDELISQGWLEVKPSKGTYVSQDLPEIHVKGESAAKREEAARAFEFDPLDLLQRKHPDVAKMLTLDEGTPDVRIAPITEILRNYRSILSRSYNVKYLDYGSFYGDMSLREELVNYFKDTRGLTCDVDQILVTRGSQMGMYLASQLIHAQAGISVIGETNYIAANLTLQYAGAELKHVSVDDKGIVTDEIEAICQKHKIKSVYVTSHHHHPTTVTMSADRRLHLVELAKKYNFAILEDDYDYDFHYQRAPYLPLASIDTNDHVVYMGALCKIVAPAIRVGYMVGPKDFIESAGQLRRIIDRQGDTVMEMAIAQMIKQGDIQRHSRKALKLYLERRDHFEGLLNEHLSDYVTFQRPEGGLAFWVLLRKDLDWAIVAERCLKKGLSIPEATVYDYNDLKHNGVRMGFASADFNEQKRIVSILKEVMDELSQEK